MERSEYKPALKIQVWGLNLWKYTYIVSPTTSRVHATIKKEAIFKIVEDEKNELRESKITV